MRRGRKYALLRDEAGAVAIEFALLAPAVLLLIFIILEITMMYVAQSVLDKTVALAAREIRTNQDTAANAIIGDRIREIACGDVRLMDCDEKLQIQILSFSQLEDMTAPGPEDPESYMPGSGDADTGGPGSYVVMRVFYPWEFMLPGLGALAGTSGFAVSAVTGEMVNLSNFVMLGSGTAFRREL